MPLAEISGRRYGPVAVPIVGSSVSSFVAATGDDPDRWARHVPPSYAAAALFAVAPAFLADPDVAPETRSLIHTEQVFSWHRPLAIGETVEVEGRISGVRARRSLNLVTFELTATGEAGPWLDGMATFLMSAETANAAVVEEPEPAHDARAETSHPEPAPLPSPGGEIPPMARSASRADLVRYAAACGDWNPIHWDHDAAVAAGLPGIVVHGLLMASWLNQAAARHGAAHHPLAGMRMRFRKPLRPAAQASITGVVAGDGELSLALNSGGTTLVTATARVTACGPIRSDGMSENSSSVLRQETATLSASWCGGIRTWCTRWRCDWSAPTWLQM